MLTLGVLREATNTASITQFVQGNIVANSDWQVEKVQRRQVRLDPPNAYWAVYKVVLGGGERIEPELGTADAEIETGSEAADEEPHWSEERELRLVARGTFDEHAWHQYRSGLETRYQGRSCDPLNGLGYPAFLPEQQLAIWFYPVDPGLPMLVAAADSGRMLRTFRNMKRELLEVPARIVAVQIERTKYEPEKQAILKYTIVTDPPSASVTIYGKLQDSTRAAESQQVLVQLWRLSRQTGGLLRVPKPLGYYPELGLSLQTAVPGEATSSDRTKPEFQEMAKAAGEAVAKIHEANLPGEREWAIEFELSRLESVLEQFALVHPKAHFSLRELLYHLRMKLQRTPGEEWLTTHGDLKYDQFIHHDGEFSLIDFDWWGYAETSFDLGKFCAYLIPSMPETWQQTYAAEEARKVFLDTYRELRPDATLQRFQLYEAINLANRAMVLMWGQQSGWMPAAEQLLTLAMERLNSRLP